MKTFSIIIITGILFILSSCSGGKYLEMTTSSESAITEGNYTQALEYSEQIISDAEGKGKSAPGKVYSLAGISAYELENFDKSLAYLSKAIQQEYSDGNTYWYLAMNYRHIDNLSKEITFLEMYLKEYPEGAKINLVQERLFQTCLESENFELAEQLWTQLDIESREDIRNMEVYLKLNSMQGNDSKCNSLSNLILKKDADNESALSCLGEYHYRQAENSYQFQMKAYKENRTRKQYAILLKAFEQVNVDFKKSRDYYMRLYKLYPKPEYASYLSKIFTRLEDEQQAAYYKRRAG